MAELVPRYLDNDAIAVIEGDGAVSQELIAQGFDHLLFTGGTEIGRKVYEGAAPHLTPVTLELGGKSPVIVAGRRRHRRRGQAHRLDQADQLRSDLHRAGLRAGRREDPRRARRQDQGRRSRPSRPTNTGREAHRQPAALRPADRVAGRDQGRRSPSAAARTRRRLQHPADRRGRPRSRRAVDDRRDLRPDPARS